MALFTPRNQVRNMLDAEIGQALCGGPDGTRANLTRIVALSALINQPQSGSYLADNWLEDEENPFA
jgi:hypothetical protein